MIELESDPTLFSFPSADRVLTVSPLPVTLLAASQPVRLSSVFIRDEITTAENPTYTEVRGLDSR